MRFLHTSDWHVGKLLRGRSRLDEQEAVAAEILDIATREKVDCVLLSGDVFESQAPSPDAERLVYHFFAELLGRKISSVVIGGNHDHPKRLAALRELLNRLDIHMRPEPCSPRLGGVVEIRRNNEVARIAVLPFVAERKIVDVCQLMNPESTWYSAYSDCVADMCLQLTECFDANAINIFMAHLYADKAQLSGTEREVHVAPNYSISPERFPANAHYIALGHLHRPQDIPAPSPCKYAGSTLQLDFGEQGQDKRVVIMDAHAGPHREFESIRLQAGRRLRYVAGSLDQLRRQVDSFGDDFLHVTVRSETPVAGMADQVRDLLPHAVHVQTQYPARDAEITVAALGPKPPGELFADYCKKQRDVAPSKEMSQLFAELYDEVLHASD